LCSLSLFLFCFTKLKLLNAHVFSVCVYDVNERETEKEIDTERETERDREEGRERGRKRQREKEREKERERVCVCAAAYSSSVE
jgi:hypothetical protein